MKGRAQERRAARCLYFYFALCIIRTMAKRDLQSVMDTVTEAASKLKKTGGMTKKNQFDFLMKIAQIGGLDNADPEVKKLKRVWGEQLRERREANSLSLRDVASQSWFAFRTVKKIEDGDAHIGFYPVAHILLEVCISKLTTDSAKEKAEPLPHASTR